MPLNTQQLKALKPKADRKQYTVSDLGEPGLSILVSENSKVFYYRYRTKGGRQKRLKIGKFDSVSLSEAKKKAKQYYLAVANGKDPLAEIKSEAFRLKSREVGTVQDLWDVYRTKIDLVKRSADFEEYLWRNYVGAEFAKYDIDDFERIAIKAYIQNVRSEKSASLANRIQSLITALGKFGFEELDVFSANPARGLGARMKEKSRVRNLKPEELREVWRGLNSFEVLKHAKISLPMSKAIKLLIHTLCRRNEVIGLRWSEVDFKTKIISLPPARVKNKRIHLVPISEHALAEFNYLKVNLDMESEFVFPSPRTESHFYPGAATKACKRLSQTLNISFTLHDFRRTGSTILTSEKFSYSRFLVSRGLLNHASELGGAASAFGHYDKNDYIKEKREALNTWSDYLVSFED